MDICSLSNGFPAFSLKNVIKRLYFCVVLTFEWWMLLWSGVTVLNGSFYFIVRNWFLIFFLPKELGHNGKMKMIHMELVLVYIMYFIDYFGFSNRHKDSFLYLVMSAYCKTILLIRMGRMHGHSSSILPILWKEAWAPWKKKKYLKNDK